MSTIRHVSVPGDKSISHRALLLASLATGTSRLRGILAGDDTIATAAAMRALGVIVPVLPTDGSEIRVTGHGFLSWREPSGAIDCGNSGTTARLLLGALAAHPFAVTLTGDASLRARPMRRVTEPLARMGARLTELGAPDRLPIRVAGGALSALEWSSPHASAQVKSALLLAGLLGGVPVRVSEPVLSRDHTERMLVASGIALERGTDASGRAFVALSPPQRIDPFDLDVPGDFSSAACFLALGLLGRAPLRVRGVGLNPTRTGLLEAARRMGGDVRIENMRDAGGEPAGDIVASPSSLHGVRIDPHEVPAMLDEIPILAMLAACAEGQTTITGASELRVKESDRLAALARNLRGLGVTVDETADGLIIHGEPAHRTGRVETLGDHRIAMAFGVLGALPDNHIEIDDPGIVAVSFPGFWRALDQVHAPA